MVLACSRDRDHLGAEDASDLHRRDADATGGAGDQHPLSCFQIGLGDESVVRGDERLGESARFVELNVTWHEQEVLGGHHAVRRLRAAADEAQTRRPSKRSTTRSPTSVTTPASSMPGMSSGQPGGAG